MVNQINRFQLSIEDIRVPQRELSYFKEFRKGMGGSLMEYDIGGEISVEINGIKITEKRFNGKSDDNTFFVWYPLFFIFTTNILTHVPLNMPINSDVLEIEDFSWKITDVNFPKFYLSITQTAMDKDVRFQKLEVDYFTFKTEILREQGKLMKFLEEIGNPRIFTNHPNFKYLMDGWKLIQTDYFDRVFPNLSIDQIKKEQENENSVISRLAKRRLEYKKKSCMN